MSFGGCRHGKTNASHTAACISPHAVFSIDLAKHMMPHNVYRARRLWANKGADDALTCKGSPQVVRLKVIGQHVIQVAEHQVAVNLLILALEACGQIAY